MVGYSLISNRCCNIWPVIVSQSTAAIVILSPNCTAKSIHSSRIFRQCEHQPAKKFIRAGLLPRPFMVFCLKCVFVKLEKVNLTTGVKSYNPIYYLSPLQCPTRGYYNAPCTARQPNSRSALAGSQKTTGTSPARRGASSTGTVVSCTVSYIRTISNTLVGTPVPML